MHLPNYQAQEKLEGRRGWVLQNIPRLNFSVHSTWTHSKTTVYKALFRVMVFRVNSVRPWGVRRRLSVRPQNLYSHFIQASLCFYARNTVWVLVRHLWMIWVWLIQSLLVRKAWGLLSEVQSLSWARKSCGRDRRTLPQTVVASSVPSVAKAWVQFVSLKMSNFSHFIKECNFFNYMEREISDKYIFKTKAKTDTSLPWIGESFYLWWGSVFTAAASALDTVICRLFPALQAADCVCCASPMAKRGLSTSWVWGVRRHQASGSMNT